MNNIVKMEFNVPVFSCGACDHTAFHLCDNGVIRCTECKDIVDGLEWIQTQDE